MNRYLPSPLWKISAWKAWTSYVHWRLETFGLFAPNGKLNWKALGILLKQLFSYQRWVHQLNTLRTKSYRVIR